MSFSLAIVGRPNVGKSTLFNRLVGKRIALVDDRPGVTRDLREGEAHLGDLTFTAIDTAGLEEETDESLPARMRRHPGSGRRLAGAGAFPGRRTAARQEARGEKKDQPWAPHENARYPLTGSGRMRRGCHDAADHMDRIQSTMMAMFSSLTWAFGGMGTGPQVPDPPFLTLAISMSRAAASPAYLAAISL